MKKNDQDIQEVEYKGYKARVEWSEEDQLYVGEVIGIKDIVSFHAKKKQDIEKKFHMSIDNYCDALSLYF